MYTYDELTDDVNYLARLGAETGSIGSTAYGNMIPFVHIRGDGKPIIVTAGIHARENVSSVFAIKQIYRIYASAHRCNAYFVPMVNPDGNILYCGGVNTFGADAKKIRGINGGSDDFSLWKANARGVDLNVNFDVDWGKGKQNVFSPAPQNYVGAKPHSEPETQALAEFTERISPCLTISYHALGQEIYFDFNQRGADYARDEKIAVEASRLTGYKLVYGTQGSAGGYKDWCVRKFGIPSLTVELVSDKFSHPLPDTAIAEDFEREPVLPEKLYSFMEAQGLV